MARPLTRSQRLENAAFLRALRSTGNAREAARLVGAHRAKFTRRRTAHPAFAAEWDAALALADAALTTGPAAEPSPAEPRLVRLANGRHQLRRPAAVQLDRAAQQRFLAALSATANVRLSAAAAGFSHSAFFQLRRRNPGFAREWRLALAEGFARIEMALLESYAPASHADDAWRHNDPPAIPPMTAAEALQLLSLHQKEVRLQAEPPHLKRRRGESREAHSYRLSVMYELRLERDREAYRVAEANRRAAEEHAPIANADTPAPAQPDLSQVTGWSKGRSEGRLVGGWRANRFKS